LISREVSALPRTIEVIEYDPLWPILFQEIEKKMQILFARLQPEIYHVGSTSVPGLWAKPKIDVDILMPSEEAIQEGVKRMRAKGGYHFHGDRYRDGMWVFSTTTRRGSHGERIYLCAPDHKTHIERILFRNYLRAHPSVASEYGDLKRRLAEEAVDDSEYYTEKKGPFVAEIIRRATECGAS